MLNDIAAGKENPKRDRKIERRTFFAKVSRSEVDHGLVAREVVTRILHRAANAFNAFLDSRVGKANDVGPGESTVGTRTLDRTPESGKTDEQIGRGSPTSRGIVE